MNAVKSMWWFVAGWTFGIAFAIGVVAFLVWLPE